jgi:hypothetical protein
MKEHNEENTLNELKSSKTPTSPLTTVFLAVYPFNF